MRHSVESSTSWLSFVNTLIQPTRGSSAAPSGESGSSTGLETIFDLKSSGSTISARGFSSLPLDVSEKSASLSSRVLQRRSVTQRWRRQSIEV